MKSFIVFALFVAAAVAVPVDPNNPYPNNPYATATILRSENDNIGVEGYNFAYETSNGIGAQESGQLEGTGEDQGIEVRGSYSYIGDDGVTYTVTYTAGRKGFEPSGAHIPKP